MICANAWIPLPVCLRSFYAPCVLPTDSMRFQNAALFTLSPTDNQEVESKSKKFYFVKFAKDLTKQTFSLILKDLLSEWCEDFAKRQR